MCQVRGECDNRSADLLTCDSCTETKGVINLPIIIVTFTMTFFAFFIAIYRFDFTISRIIGIIL